jgi:aminoglycoside phosphotransferase (APT) family kinase protein
VVDRVFPLIETDASPGIAKLLNGKIARSQLVAGGLTNTLRRVELTDGRVIGVKQFVLGSSYTTEETALRKLAGIFPVPEILVTLDRVIAYRWIEGVTLDECRRRTPSALGALAAPLGRMLGALAHTRRDTPPLDLTPTFAQLDHGLVQSRLGGSLAETVRRLLEAHRFDDPMCFVHGDFSARNVLVARSLDRVVGLLDWEAATTGSVLRDVGSLFRYANRYDAAFRAAFERAHGHLPVDWFQRARLLDTTQMIAALAQEREQPVVHFELRNVVAQIAASPYRR